MMTLRRPRGYEFEVRMALGTWLLFAGIGVCMAFRPDPFIPPPLVLSGT